MEQKVEACLALKPFDFAKLDIKLKITPRHNSKDPVKSKPGHQSLD
jgi:hypothetical protein